MEWKGLLISEGWGGKLLMSFVVLSDERCREQRPENGRFIHVRRSNMQWCMNLNKDIFRDKLQTCNHPHGYKYCIIFLTSLFHIHIQITWITAVTISSKTNAVVEGKTKLESDEFSQLLFNTGVWFACRVTLYDQRGVNVLWKTTSVRHERQYRWITLTKHLNWFSKYSQREMKLDVLPSFVRVSVLFSFAERGRNSV